MTLPLTALTQVSLVVASVDLTAMHTVIAWKRTVLILMQTAMLV